MIEPTYSIDPSNSLFDWEALAEDSIELSIEQIERAIQIGQSIPNPAQQWQLYLHTLAVFGLEQWLTEWAPDLPIDDTDCSVYQPAYANLIEAACNLHIGPFTLCLMVMGAMPSLVVHLPRAAVDLPQFTPHFYVLMQVLEDQNQVHFCGYLRRDRLVKQQQTHPSEMASHWSYPIPLEWFNPDLAAFLVELRCLDPDAITVFPPPCSTEISIAELQPQLAPLLADPLLRPSQVLNWREGAVLLSHPELAAWLLSQQIATQSQQGQSAAVSVPTAATPFIVHPSSYSYTEASDILALTAPSAAALPLPRQQQVIQAINVGPWLNDRLDRLAQDLAWTLMPAFAPTAALRSLEEEIENRGIWIPPNARGAYQDLRFEKIALRLYAITWVLSLTYKTCEWTLLFILGAPPDQQLPPGISLQIRDQEQLLVEQTLKPETPDAYLYAQVGGNSEESFWATIDLNNGSAITLPPFTFRLEKY